MKTTEGRNSGEGRKYTYTERHTQRDERERRERDEVTRCDTHKHVHTREGLCVEGRKEEVDEGGV